MIVREENIRAALSRSLPGEASQLIMAPHVLGSARGPIPPSMPGTRKSGVLLLLCPDPETGQTQFTLTLRSSRLLSHSGQLSLPGGRIERDETAIQAALRETREEIGVPENMPRILGSLTPLHVPHSGNLIFPVVAWIDELPGLILEPFEVSEAFQVNVADLFDTHRLHNEIWNLRGESFSVPFWSVHTTVPLWGATAMILSEFCTLIE